MPSRWDAATHGWSRRVFHYPLPTLMSRNFRLPCTIELQPLSLTLLKMRKVEFRWPDKSSFPRKRESIQIASRQLTYNQATWIPAFAGMTGTSKPIQLECVCPARLVLALRWCDALPVDATWVGDPTRLGGPTASASGRRRGTALLHFWPQGVAVNLPPDARQRYIALASSGAPIRQSDQSSPISDQSSRSATHGPSERHHPRAATSRASGVL